MFSVSLRYLRKANVNVQNGNGQGTNKNRNATEYVTKNNSGGSGEGYILLS